MKKNLALILTIALSAALFTGCASSTANSPQSGQPVVAPTASASPTDVASDPDSDNYETTDTYETADSDNTPAEASSVVSTETNDGASASIATDDEENYGTGDASLDNPRNDDSIGTDELLVVSFGTSYNDNRRLSIGGIESALEAALSRTVSKPSSSSPPI